MLNSNGWYYGWNVIGAGIIFQAILFGLTLFSFIFWAPIWAEEFDAKLADVMWVNVGMMLAQGFMSPFVGHAMDRRSIKWLITAGAIIASAGFLLVSRATQVWHIVVVYSTLVPLGMLLAGPLAAQTLAAKWFSLRRGLAIGISTTGTSIGGFILPFVVGILFYDYGWRHTHLILAGFVLVTVIPVVWLVVSNSPEEKGVPSESKATDSQKPAFEYPVWTTLTILKQRNFWVLVLAFVPLISAQGAVQANIAAFAIDLGTSQDRTPMLISLMAITAVAGKVFFGRQADHWDHRYLFLLAAALIATVIALMLTQPGYSIQLVIAGILGIGTGAILPLLGVIIASRFGPNAHGQVMGLLGPFLMLSALGSVYAANAYDSTGSYASALEPLFLCLIAAAIVVMWLGGKPEEDVAIQANPR